VESWTVVMLPPGASFILPSASAYISLGPICVSNQASFNSWFNTPVPLTCVGNLDLEWLVV